MLISADNQNKVYGAALPTLTANYTGLVNGDTAVSLTTPPSVEHNGNSREPSRRQPVSDHRGRSCRTDYTISYSPGTLTVTPAVLTVSADNKSMVYGSVCRY